MKYLFLENSLKVSLYGPIEYLVRPSEGMCVGQIWFISFLCPHLGGIIIELIDPCGVYFWPTGLFPQDSPSKWVFLPMSRVQSVPFSSKLAHMWYLLGVQKVSAESLPISGWTRHYGPKHNFCTITLDVAHCCDLYFISTCLHLVQYLKLNLKQGHHAGPLLATCCGPENMCVRLILAGTWPRCERVGVVEFFGLEIWFLNIGLQERQDSIFAEMWPTFWAAANQCRPNTLWDAIADVKAENCFYEVVIYF